MQTQLLSQNISFWRVPMQVKTNLHHEFMHAYSTSFMRNRILRKTYRSLCGYVSADNYFRSLQRFVVLRTLP